MFVGPAFPQLHPNLRETKISDPVDALHISHMRHQASREHHRVNPTMGVSLEVACLRSPAANRWRDTAMEQAHSFVG